MALTPELGEALAQMEQSSSSPHMEPRLPPVDEIYPTVVPPASDDAGDGFGGMIGDEGLGGENEGTGDNEGDSLPRDSLPERNASSRTARTARWEHPEWLKQAYKDKISFVKATTDNDGLCALYRPSTLQARLSSDPKKLGLGSFEFPREEPVFRSSTTPEHYYNPRFFLWDPMPLCRKENYTLQCAACGSGLGRHGWPDRPRRIAVLSGSLFLIGHRYICHNAKCQTKTMMSYDQRVLDQLPRHLQACFPFRLTHRSGCSEDLLRLLIHLVSMGFGTSMFSNLLRDMQLQVHDQRKVAYLTRILASPRPAPNTKYTNFGNFEDGERNAGFVPSGHWLRELFDDEVATRAANLDQRMAMLDARIISLDHSHKVRSTSA